MAYLKCQNADLSSMADADEFLQQQHVDKLTLATCNNHVALTEKGHCDRLCCCQSVKHDTTVNCSSATWRVSHCEVPGVGKASEALPDVLTKTTMLIN